MPVAHYDQIADWYAAWVDDGDASEYSARVREMLRDLLGRPSGANLCVDICCGTGVRAATLRELGWDPIGLDLSLGQLGYAAKVMPVAAADAVALPLRDACADATTCILAHTDVPDYAAVAREAARILKPGATFVHIGVHPAFTGAFADRTDPARIIVDCSYDRRERRFDSFTPAGVRAKVGAWHLPLADLLHTVLDAGLTVTRVSEAGPHGAVPDLFGFVAVR